MKILANGVDRFRSEVHPRMQERFSSLAAGQAPKVLFVTCSDSRIDPSLVTQTQPGELFVLRNAGNLVPPRSAGDLGSASAVEYAVVALGVEHIVVCGHSNCGAMGALVNPESASALPIALDWLDYAEPTARWIEHEQVPAGDAQAAAIDHNVHQQIANLLTYSFVSDAVAEGRLSLHGWVYDIPSGEVRDLDVQIGASETPGSG